MNEAFGAVIAASDEERRDLFLATSVRLGTAVQNVEKDFWVCWTLDALFNGLRQWYDRRGELRQGGQRVTRHYYDLHLMMQAVEAPEWQRDRALALDCARHARLFFGSTDLGLQFASPGAFTLMPGAAMRSALAKDYEAMAGMVFGVVPSLDDVLESVQRLEKAINDGL